MSVTVDAVAGARAEPESVFEQSEAGEVEDSETSALVGLVAQGRHAFGAPWVSVSGAAWGYLPEGEASLLRLEPGAGLVLGRSEGWHGDLAVRYALLEVLGFPEVVSGRAELVGRFGWGGGPHRLELVGGALDHAYWQRPAWSLRAAEAGAQWRTQGDHLATLVRAGGQVNQGEDDAGAQLRTRGSLGWTAPRLDLALGYDLIVATGGEDDTVFRPPFDPMGAPNGDADALSAGGFVQHGLDLRAWTDLGPAELTVQARGRIRDRGPYETLNATVDLARPLSDQLAVHGLVGLAAWRIGANDLLDPYGWIGLRWTPTP
ncbi:MAG: hypothetical protein H6738_10780 [Alphaproteobacteria bacterium]|nr:hypothetical protein [Alphaproteobacteria bacterium]MCB9697255.1 hypothetical protein [Alphaproteobacteria bacterium]